MSKISAADIYSAIRHDIITGVIHSSELIREQAVAERFSVNRLTAREALQRLCNEKYLKNFPRKGYLIAEITAQQLKKIKQVRYQIESLAIQTVIQTCSDVQIEQLREILADEDDSGDPDHSITNRFHLQIARLSGNEYIYDDLQKYLGYTTRYAMTAIYANRFSEYVPYHEKIVEAMLHRDTAAACEWLRKDLMLD